MQIPSTMKAAAINRFGPPSAIAVHERPVPKPGADELLIRIDVAGVGSWDPAIRDGSWPPKRARFPLVLGTDGTGVVVGKGAKVKRFRVGDRVYAYEFGNPKGGFYAEYVAVKAKHAARVPRQLRPLEAGAAVPVALTALQGVVNELDLRRGQVVLIFGASGAVGSLAVQFAKQRGARVLATASGKRATALVRRLGADAVVDARRDESIKRLWKLAPHGIDAALAFAGGERLERCLDVMRPGGRVAFPNGIEPGAPRRRRSVRCSSYDLDVTPRWFEKLHRSITKTPIHVPIAAVFPLSRAADAHRRLARGAIRGSMVLRVRHPISASTSRRVDRRGGE
ncbi:MAG TPA: NADP-dependent oxidoreductase [Steroidobacteraceae bacterium]|jgi:NADPH:quinone reductase-like Zn-dependent oxidoreductase|nr:NADP-dependent oxidoreductase [Steroidobacteraceae bacterium]